MPILFSVAAMWMPLNHDAQSQEILPYAAKTADTAGAAPPQQAPVKFQLLRVWKFDFGDHVISLNRVAPPIVPSEPASIPALAAVENTPAKKPEARAPRKNTELLSLSATVCDHTVTEVRAFAGDRDCRFYINIDFNLLAGLGSFETAETSYLLILGVENRTRAEADAFNNRAAREGRKAVPRQIPPLESFSKTRSEYIVAKDEAGAQPPAEILAAINGLLAYYDANRSRLAEDYAKREAARSAQEQSAKEHPPALQDTVIHYWKNGTIPPPSQTKEK